MKQIIKWITTKDKNQQKLRYLYFLVINTIYKCIYILTKGNKKKSKEKTEHNNKYITLHKQWVFFNVLTFVLLQNKRTVSSLSIIETFANIIISSNKSFLHFFIMMQQFLYCTLLLNVSTSLTNYARMLVKLWFLVFDAVSIIKTHTLIWYSVGRKKIHSKITILRVPLLPCSCVVPPSVATQVLGSGGTALQLSSYMSNKAAAWTLCKMGP